MPKVFVHGVPDTPRMWQPLFDALGDDAKGALRPAMPGFVELAPTGFEATMDGYADWLVDVVDELAAERGPVDLVGHDWGALLTLRVAHLRPDAVASWAIFDGAFDPQYRGHFFARVWATRGLGELSMALGARPILRRMMRMFGLPPERGDEVADENTAEMRRCILELYRSADGLRGFGRWYAGLDDMPPRGRVIWGAKDPFLSVDVAERVAARAEVPLHVEPGAGHWLPVTHPEVAARELRALWAS